MQAPGLFGVSRKYNVAMKDRNGNQARKTATVVHLSITSSSNCVKEVATSLWEVIGVQVPQNYTLGIQIAIPSGSK